MLTPFNLGRVLYETQMKDEAAEGKRIAWVKWRCLREDIKVKYIKLAGLVIRQLPNL